MTDIPIYKGTSQSIQKNLSSEKNNIIFTPTNMFRFLSALFVAFTLAILLLSSETSASKLENPKTAFLPEFAIYPLNQSESTIRRFDVGSVSGWRSCGGPGKLLDMRIAGCKPDSLCTLTANISHHSEVEFVPSENIPQVGVRANLVEAGGVVTTLLERRFPNTPLLGGQAYQSRELGGVSDAFKGETVTLQYVLFRVADNVTELCGEAEFRFV